MVKELTHTLRRVANVSWNWEEHHINCLNHVINLGVEWFIKSIKAENTESEMSSMLTTLSEKDDSEEEDDCFVALQVDDTEDSEEVSFSNTMKKIRTIVKVVFLYPICNTQLGSSKPLYVTDVCYKFAYSSTSTIALYISNCFTKLAIFTIGDVLNCVTMLSLDGDPVMIC